MGTKLTHFRVTAVMDKCSAQQMLIALIASLSSRNVLSTKGDCPHLQTVRIYFTPKRLCVTITEIMIHQIAI
jgi:hypothetical protein